MTTLTLPAEQIDWRAKGFWLPGQAVPAAEFAAARHPLFGGPFSWPVMVLRRTALEHNLAALAAFCRRHGLAFAPHGKTTMAPSLFAAQLAAGAWGITVATAAQALACRAFGVPRVLLANELLDPEPLRWAVGEIERGAEFLCYVDSVAGVAAMAQAVASAPGRSSLPVLAELGHANGRTGCRSAAELVEVARAVAAAPRLELAGVAGYEGGLPGTDEVAAYLAAMCAATRELSAEGLLSESVIVTAGGSAYFDLVAEALGGSWLPGHTVRTILRSGAYVTHDDGFYGERTPFHRRPEEGSLEAALEIWAQVTSTPEDGLAIAGMGKRDAPFDEGLPVPLRLRRRDGTVVAAAGMRVARLNDQHAYLELRGPARPVPGDLVCFGISHPCTAFDKWRFIPVVDDDHTVTDVLHTYF
jgi:D-serine deaminase-like pyridoxal phosphate-dependent protein